MTLNKHSNIEHSENVSWSLLGVFFFVKSSRQIKKYFLLFYGHSWTRSSSTLQNVLTEVEPTEQEVTRRCDTFQSAPAHWYSITAAEEAVNLHFYKRISLPSSALFFRPRTPSASKCIWPQFSSAQDESVCVCVCALTSDWFELRADIYTEWVAAQLWYVPQNFLWFACSPLCMSSPEFSSALSLFSNHKQAT